LDGNDIDGNGSSWLITDLNTAGNTGTVPNRSTPTDETSMKLLRKTINALWRASRGDCGQVGGSCWLNASADVWEPSMCKPDGSSQILGGGTGACSTSVTAHVPLNNSPTYLDDFGGGGSKSADGLMVGFGVSQLTDIVWFPNMMYAGRFTLLSEDSDG